MDEDLGAVSLDTLTTNLKKGTTWAVRVEAAEALAEIADPKSIDLLNEALLNENQYWIVRAKAAESLAKIADPSSLSIFSEILKKSDDPRVTAAVKVAGINFESRRGLTRVVPDEPLFKWLPGIPFGPSPDVKFSQLPSKEFVVFLPIIYGACSKYGSQPEEHYRGIFFRQGQTCKCSLPLITLELKSIDVTPKNKQIKPGEEIKFKAKGIDQYGLPFDLREILWAASGGGDITKEGTFLAGREKGSFSIGASYKNTLGSTNVTIS